MEDYLARMGNQIDRMKEMLLAEADQLEAWANESVYGGWSAHQVQLMRERANQIRLRLFTLGVL